MNEKSLINFQSILIIIIALISLMVVYQMTFNFVEKISAPMCSFSVTADADLNTGNERTGIIHIHSFEFTAPCGNDGFVSLDNLLNGGSGFR